MDRFADLLFARPFDDSIHPLFCSRSPSYALGIPSAQAHRRHASLIQKRRPATRNRRLVKRALVLFCLTQQARRCRCLSFGRTLPFYSPPLALHTLVASSNTAQAARTRLDAGPGSAQRISTPPTVLRRVAITHWFAPSPEQHSALNTPPRFPPSAKSWKTST